MGDVIDRDLAFAFSLNQLCEVTGSTYRTVKKRLAEAAVASVGSRSGHPVYPLSQAMPAILFPKPGLPVDLDECPEARRAWFQSENERLKFETLAIQLIPREEAAKGLHAVASAICAHLPDIPGLLKKEAGLDNDAVQVVQEQIDAMTVFIREGAAAYDDAARH